MKKHTHIYIYMYVYTYTYNYIYTLEYRRECLNILLFCSRGMQINRVLKNDAE